MSNDIEYLNYEEEKLFYNRVDFKEWSEINVITKNLIECYAEYIADDLMYNTKLYYLITRQNVEVHYFQMDNLIDNYYNDSLFKCLVPNVDEYYEIFADNLTDKALLEDMREYYLECNSENDDETIKSLVDNFIVSMILHWEMSEVLSSKNLKPVIDKFFPVTYDEYYGDY